MKFSLGIFMAAGLVFGACSQPDTAAAPDTIDITDAVKSAGVNSELSTLKIVRLSDGQVWQSGAERASQRFSPASTSKIPHTLIMIEDGLAQPDTAFKWDGVKRTFAGWNQDQTLTSAYKRSAVWVYQSLTAQNGHEAMQDWVERLDYGNANTGTEQDIRDYWLKRILEISADEQIAFLTRLSQRELPFSADTYDKALPIFAEKKGEAYTFYGKTGWYYNDADTNIGWYVGWVTTMTESGHDTYVFAFNMDMPDGSERRKRKIVVTQSLSRIGAIPETPTSPQ